MPTSALLVFAVEPAAEIFPLLEGEELAALVADIKTHGLRQPIVTHEGMILDGRNRLRACRLSGVEPRFVEFQGNDPVAFVVSANLQRRHLDTSQRAMLAAKLAGMRPVGRPSKSSNLRISQEAAGKGWKICHPFSRRSPAPRNRPSSALEVGDPADEHLCACAWWPSSPRSLCAITHQL